MKKSMKNENEGLKKTGRLRSMRKAKKLEQENERESARHKIW